MSFAVLVVLVLLGYAVFGGGSEQNEALKILGAGVFFFILVMVVFLALV